MREDCKRAWRLACDCFSKSPCGTRVSRQLESASMMLFIRGSLKPSSCNDSRWGDDGTPNMHASQMSLLCSSCLGPSLCLLSPSPASLHAPCSSPAPSFALRFPSLSSTLHSQVTFCATSTQEEGKSLCRISSPYQLKPKLFSATCFWAHWEFVLLPDTLMLHRLSLIHLYKMKVKP